MSDIKTINDPSGLNAELVERLVGMTAYEIVKAVAVALPEIMIVAENSTELQNFKEAAEAAATLAGQYANADTDEEIEGASSPDDRGAKYWNDLSEQIAAEVSVALDNALELRNGIQDNLEVTQIAMQVAMDLGNAPLYASLADPNLPVADGNQGWMIIPGGAEEGIYQDDGAWTKKYDTQSVRATIEADRAEAAISNFNVYPFDGEHFGLVRQLFPAWFVNPTTTTTVFNENSLTQAAGNRAYFRRPLSDFDVQVGDRIRFAYKRVAGDASPSSFRFESGTNTFIETVNLTESFGYWQVDVEVPATAEYIELDYTNVSGDPIEWTYPEIGKIEEARQFGQTNRERLGNILTGQVPSGELFVSAADTFTSTGNTATINADGSITVPFGSLTEIRGEGLTEPLSTGDEVIIIAQTEENRVTNMAALFRSSGSQVATLAMEHLADNLWIYIGPMPALTGDVDASRIGVRVDHRGTGLRGTWDEETDVKVTKVFAFRGNEIPVLSSESNANVATSPLLIAQSAGVVDLLVQGAGDKSTLHRISETDDTATTNTKKCWSWAASYLAQRTAATEFTLGEQFLGGEQMFAFIEGVSSVDKAANVGGVTHGYERTNVAGGYERFLADGVPFTPDGETKITCNLFAYEQRSQIFSIYGANNGLPIIDKVTQLEAQGHEWIDLIHRFEFLEDVPVWTFNVAMASIDSNLGSGDQFGYGARSPLFAVEDMTGAFVEIADTAKRARSWGPFGVGVDIEMLEGWKDAGRRFYFQDPPAKEGKMYFQALTGGAVIPSGTVLETKARFRIS